MTDGDPAAASHRDLLDAAPIGIVVHADGVIRYANDRVAGILDLDAPSELEGRDILEFVPRDDRTAATERIRRIQDEGATTDAREYRVLRPDGQERWVEARGRPVVWEGESCVQVALQDVTERKRAQEALRQSERRFRQVFQRARDPIYIADGEGRILEANPAFAELFGYDREELDRVRAHQLYADAGDRQRLRRAIAENGAVEDYEVRLKRSDGREMICEVSAVGVRDDDGVRYEGLIRDVTEERQARDEWEYRALHDDLTGLPNRSLLRDRMKHGIERSDRRDSPLGMLFVDIDGFKAINDRHGHSNGDRVLREAGRAMDDAVRDEDTVARVGGDEFAVVLEGVDGPDDLQAAARRLREYVGSVERTPDGSRTIRVSVGTALYDPAAVDTEAPALDRARQLLDRADRKMLEQKAEKEAAR